MLTPNTPRTRPGAHFAHCNEFIEFYLWKIQKIFSKYFEKIFWKNSKNIFRKIQKVFSKNSKNIFKKIQKKLAENNEIFMFYVDP